MPTVKEYLEVARNNFAQQLAELSTKRKPSYSIAGRSVSWVEYMRFLREQLSEIEDLIAAEDDGTITATALD